MTEKELTKKELKKLKKKNKKKGPIRTEAIIPIVALILIVVLFNIFFLDALIKKGMESIGTRVYGAQVDVSDFKSSFLDLSVKVGKIEFTNKEKPELNLFEIGSIEFKGLWDAALRAKLVIENVEVKDILLMSKRKSPGKVLPPGDPNSAQKQLREKVLNKFQDAYEGNILGEIAGILGGKGISKVKDSLLKGLKSEKLYAEVSKQFDKRKDELEKAKNNLPSDKDLKSFEKRFNDIDWGGIGDLRKAPKVLKEISELEKDVSKAVKSVDTAKRKVDESVKYFEGAKKQADNSIDEDVNSVSKRMKIPQLDSKSITGTLFGKEIYGKLDQVAEYQKIAKDYMPPKRKKEEPKYAKPPRQAGRNYQFGTPRSYPSYWIKKVAINSKNNQGSIAGAIKNISADQNLAGAPTTAKINGDFPGVDVRGVKADLVFDHRQEVPRDSMQASVDSYPVTNKLLTKSNDVTLSIAKASLASTMSAKFNGEIFDIKILNKFNNSELNYDSPSNELKRLLAAVSKKANLVTLEILAKGALKDLKLEAKSNLANLIQSAVAGVVKERIKEEEQKIRQAVEGKIADERKKVEAQLAQVKNQYEGELKKTENELNKFKKDIDNKVKKEKKNAEKNLFKGIKGIKL